MKIVQQYDKKIISEISKSCGSKNVKKTYSYLNFAFYYTRKGNKNFICEILDDSAFYAGTVGKEHFRLLEIAVKKESQGRGYGKAMIIRIKRFCKKWV